MGKRDTGVPRSGTVMKDTTKKAIEGGVVGVGGGFALLWLLCHYNVLGICPPCRCPTGTHLCPDGSCLPQSENCSVPISSRFNIFGV